VVEADPAHDHDEPAAYVLDLVDVGPQEARVALLHDVLGLLDAAQHPVRDVEQVPAVGVPGGVDALTHTEPDETARRNVTSQIIATHVTRADATSSLPDDGSKRHRGGSHAQQLP